MDTPASGPPAADEVVAESGVADPWPGHSAANRTELDPLAC